MSRKKTRPAPRGQLGPSGHLTAGDGTTVPVDVRGTEEGILLVMLADPGERFGEPDQGLTLESFSSRGLVRLHGRTERVDRGMVRFYVDGEPDVVQRRQFVRVVAPQRVTLDDAFGQPVDTQSVNLSGGGMLVSGPDTLELDDEISFRLFLDEEEPPVSGVGRVVRASGDRQRAIVFEHISSADRDRLIHFIFDRQRAALAVTRGDIV